MTKAKIILAIAEIGLLAILNAFGFISHCIESHNYILLALPFVAGFALLIGIDKLISFFRRKR